MIKAQHGRCIVFRMWVIDVPQRSLYRSEYWLVEQLETSRGRILCRKTGADVLKVRRILP